MREAVFLRKNEQKWRSLEAWLAYGSTMPPDKIADYYVEMTDDLAYAQTNYPDSKTTVYLNGITTELHQLIYKNKKEKGNRFLDFWTYELPKEFYLSQRHLIYSFIVFSIATLIGVVSAYYDEGFVRVILGDEYVNMTLENIQNNDPMAVYKRDNSNEMFYQITTNNIKVDFLTFVSGIFFSLGTVYVLFKNGVMLGAFQTFFFKKGLFLTSFLTIWIHGTLEISGAIIAGAAGFVLGNSILFPGTYTRIQSLVRGAKRSVKIIIGLVPITITAGFLESYVTRLTESPMWVKILIIVSSLTFILYYFVVLPILLNRKQSFKKREISIDQLKNSIDPTA